ncbi:MAG: hypothetical protein KDA65_11895, partial [Planctomycetaceae bacterium]|nr:hypothetical protein [Planctomycetaceae bacterium]
SPVTSLNVPQFVNQPTPAPEEELNSVPVETAQAAPVVEMLEAPAEGSGMYDGGPNVIDVEGMLAGNENDLPTLEETPFPPMEAESDVMGLASADTVMQARNQASLWVISVLVVMIASVLGYYLFNTRSTTSAKAVKQKQKQKAIKPRAAVKRPNMLDNQDDPKVMEYRQKIEQKKKMFASALRREEDLQIDALINDFLPVKEEEMVITRTFNLPGIGQSFRIDPATTELQGPHFRQAAKVNRKSTETVTANVGTGKTESAGERPPAPTRSESSRPTGQPYHTIHKGGTKHFGSGR